MIGVATIVFEQNCHNCGWYCDNCGFLTIVVDVAMIVADFDCDHIKACALNIGILLIMTSSPNMIVQ